MPSDLDALIADVLQKHAAGVFLPWRRDSEVKYLIMADFGPEPLAEIVGTVDAGSVEDRQANYLVAAANAAPVLARRLKLALEALKPFAAMDRAGGLLDHVVLERGTGSDKTILTESDFRRAAIALAPEVPDDAR